MMMKPRRPGISSDISTRSGTPAPRLPIYLPVPKDLPRRRPVGGVIDLSGADKPKRPAPTALRLPAVPPPRVSRPASARRPQPQPPASPVPSPAHPRLAWVELIQYPVIAVVALVAAFNSTVGQILVAAYGIYALVRRLDARISFAAALFTLLTVPLFQVLGRPDIAGNAAIYVYELLVIGTISAVLELRKSSNLHD